jgi:hypothetical protein
MGTLMADTRSPTVHRGPTSAPAPWRSPYAQNYSMIAEEAPSPALCDAPGDVVEGVQRARRPEG